MTDRPRNNAQGASTRTDSRLADLARQVAALAASPEHQRRRRLWAEAMELRSAVPPVNFYMYRHVWAKELAGDLLRHHEGLAAEIEGQLVFQLWRAGHVPDDMPAEGFVALAPVRPVRQRPFPWGLEMLSRRSGTPGSYKPIPPIRTEDDLERVTLPAYEEDAPATSLLLEQARELIGDALPVAVAANELHWGPFEHAVRLRGMDNLLYDVYDRPEFVHRLMDRITTGMVGYHRQREAAGRVCTLLGIGHVPPGEPAGGHADRLRGCWAYCHAQSSASFSPRMYAEFVHPYNCRIAEMVGRVYYHGCEDLSGKAGIIKDLPNLRLFHVSPWTPPAPVLAEMGDAVAYEVHSHPTKVLFGEDREVREELDCRQKAMAGVPHTLTLADVETFAGRFDRILRWIETARQAAATD